MIIPAIGVYPCKPYLPCLWSEGAKISQVTWWMHYPFQKMKMTPKRMSIKPKAKMDALSEKEDSSKMDSAADLVASALIKPRIFGAGAQSGVKRSQVGAAKRAKMMIEIPSSRGALSSASSRREVCFTFFYDDFSAQIFCAYLITLVSWSQWRFESLKFFFFSVFQSLDSLGRCSLSDLCFLLSGYLHHFLVWIITLSLFSECLQVKEKVLVHFNWIQALLWIGCLLHVSYLLVSSFASSPS